MKISKIPVAFLAIEIFWSQVNPRFVKSQTTSNSPEVEGEEIALFPDWSNFSLSDLGQIQQEGEFTVSSDVIEEIGYDPSRSWSAGDRIEDIITLGDLKDTLAPQKYSIEDIYRILSREQLEGRSTFRENPEKVRSYIPPELTLANYPLSGKQTIETLAKEDEELANSRASGIAPVADLLSENGYEEKLDKSLEELSQDSDIANLSLDSIDLQEYNISSVDSISNADIEDLEGWENVPVSKIPGLSELPLSEYPNPIRTEITFIGRIDFVWGEAEVNKTQTISGSKIDGFNVPCRNNCAHLELDDIENFGEKVKGSFEGSQWIAGKNNWVNGGTGCLAGGREPTGIHPFGDTFKAVLWDTDESTDMGVVTMFFNIKTNCGDSAYFVGPVPFPQGIVTSNDWVYLGTGGTGF